MSLLRFLGLGGARSDARESETIRRIAGELEHLPPDQAKYLATFAYVLARIANADLSIDSSETAEMERIVHELAGLSSAVITVSWNTSFARSSRDPRSITTRSCHR